MTYKRKAVVYEAGQIIPLHWGCWYVSELTGPCATQPIEWAKKHIPGQLTPTVTQPHYKVQMATVKCLAIIVDTEPEANEWGEVGI